MPGRRSQANHFTFFISPGVANVNECPPVVRFRPNPEIPVTISNSDARFVDMISGSDVTISTLTRDLCLGSLGVLWLNAQAGGLPTVRQATRRFVCTPATRTQSGSLRDSEVTHLRRVSGHPAPGYGSILQVQIDRSDAPTRVSLSRSRPTLVFGLGGVQSFRSNQSTYFGRYQC